MTNKTLPELEVTALLDRRTVVVGGRGLDVLHIGEQLLILAVGNPLPGVGARLVMPKATVEVLQHAGAYVLAASPAQEEEVASSLSVFMNRSTPKIVRRRPDMNVDEKAIIGNPANEPVRVGDPVIRPSDLADFVAALAAEGAED